MKRFSFCKEPANWKWLRLYLSTWARWVFWKQDSFLCLKRGDYAGIKGRICSVPDELRCWWKWFGIVYTLFWLPILIYLYEFIFQCSAQADLPYDKILECYSNEMGLSLQLEAELKTKSIAMPREMLSFVPTIVYNGVNIDY